MIGPHLLGRKPSPPDARDYKLADFLPVEQITTKSLLQDILDLLKEILAAITGDTPTPAPAPTPTPTPPPSPARSPAPAPIGGWIAWDDADAVLDQGDTGHCVGFGGADWGNTLPVDDHFTNDDGHAIYYECKVIDGEPNQEDGSTVRSLAKALKNRGLLSTYAFAASTDEMIKFVDASGPIIVGTDWTSDMFDPSPTGLVTPTGDVEGGHCYLLVGHNPELDQFEFLNSWGDSWGVQGYFYMRVSDFAQLLAADGEACAAVELLK